MLTGYPPRNEAADALAFVIIATVGWVASLQVPAQFPSAAGRRPDNVYLQIRNFISNTPDTSYPLAVLFVWCWAVGAVTAHVLFR